MITHLPRVSFWLSAVAGGLAMTLHGLVQAACGAIAVGAGFVAYMAWRGTLARRLKSRRTPTETALSFDEVAVAEAEERIRQAAASAPCFESALHSVALVLQGEIGARSHRVYAVDAEVDRDADRAPVLLEMFADQAGFRAVARPFGPREDAMARAIREKREVAAFPMSLAVPVCRLGKVVAVIEWRAIDIAIGLGEVARLLHATRAALDREASIEGSRVDAIGEDSVWPDTLMQSTGQGQT